MPKAKVKKPARGWNGAGVAAAQERRGRRGHSIIDDVPGLADWIIEQISQIPRPALTDLLDRLKGTRFLQKLEDLGTPSLSKTTLATFVAEWKSFLMQEGVERAKRRVAIDSARTYNETDDDEELFEVDSALGTLLNVDVYERLKQTRAEGRALDEDLREDLKVAARYQTARTMRARARFMINRGIRRIEQRVEQSVTAKMNALLQKKHPEVLPFVREALRDALRAAVAEEIERP